MSVFKKILKYYLLLITIFFIGRLTLFVMYFDRIQNTEESMYLSFLYGLRMDTISACILLIIPVLLVTLFPRVLGTIIDKILKYYFLIIVNIAIYIEVATFPFISQYDSRPNYLFVEYLEYPKEVFSTVFADYKLELLFSLVLICIFSYIFIKTYKKGFLNIFEISYLKRLVFFIPLLLLLFIGIRSSFAHRPANISDAMYSSNRILNEITKNSLYSIGYAIYSSKKHSSKDIVKKYGKMSKEEAIKRVHKRLNIKNTDEKYFLTRRVKSNFKKQKNIVIFIQESIGYQFVKAVGGEDGITPHLNALAKEGILFKNLYSNGTRSIRGIAGLSAGNFSVPGKGVLKRNKSQQNYFTIAKLLKPKGYHTSFIYGGESRFDNMKSFFYGNGFNEIIDEEKFKNPSFVGTWGVCDEEVAIRANEEYKKLYKKKQKFASIIFSTSNHAPFDFPENKITLLDGVPKKSVKNAIKYADFAIGRFIELAKKEEYYKDTVFAIVADHNVRVYGDDIVPVDMFQIPGLILGNGINPLVYEKLASQPDVLATILDLAGIEGNVPIMGHSIFSDEKQNLNLMQFNNRYALRVDNKVAVLRPNTKPMTFEYKNKHLVKIKEDEELQKDLLALIIVLNEMYQNKLYK